MLKEHFCTKHSGSLPHKCKYPGCKKSFPTVRSVNAHKKTHERPFKCEYCNHQFSARAQRNRHMGNKVCIRKSFENKSRQYVDLPEKDHPKHNGSNLNYFCIKCNTGFHEHTKMILHLKQVHETSTIKKIELKSKDVLTGHFRRFRSGILPNKYKHPERKNPFQSKRRLHIHNRKHERPHKCAYCNHGLSTQAQRNRHVVNKLCRKKSYKNKFEKYADIRKKNHPKQTNNELLVRQIKNNFIKTNYNYLCEKCVTGFDREDQLILHLKDEHSNDIVYCNICDSPLENEKSRKEHVVKNHMQ